MEHRKSGWYFVKSLVPATYRLRGLNLSLASSAMSRQRDRIERRETFGCFYESQVPAAYHLPLMNQNTKYN